jgi:hypothetical protein
MADRTISRSAVLDMTIHAEPHRELLVDLLNHTDLRNISVAVHALHAGRDMTHVGKLNMVGDLVDPIPGDGLTALRIPPQKLDLLRVLGAIHPVSRCMATDTGRHRRNSGALGAFHSEVAVLAINLKITSMLVVGEGDRLTGGAGYGGSGRLRLLGPGFLPGQDESESPEEGNSRRK